MERDKKTEEEDYIIEALETQIHEQILINKKLEIRIKLLEDLKDEPYKECIRLQNCNCDNMKIIARLKEDLHSANNTNKNLRIYIDGINNGEK